MTDSSKENKAFIIGLITIIGGFASFYFFPNKDTVVLPLMTFVLGYYFGSSPGSHSKDQTINDLALMKRPDEEVCERLAKLEKPEDPVAPK